MEDNSTIAPNGVSNNDKVTPEEERVYLEKFNRCRIVVASQREVAPQDFDVTAKDFANMMSPPAKELNTGILPEEQGPALIATQAAEITEEGNNIIDVNGGSQKVQEVPEDGSRKAARIREEVKESAQTKFDKNSTNEAGENTGGVRNEDR